MACMQNITFWFYRAKDKGKKKRAMVDLQINTYIFFVLLYL